MPIGLFALSLAAFAVGTGEFIIAGILPDLSTDFGVSIPTAGLLVTVYAAAVAIGGPILATLTAGLPRKPMLVALLALFCAAQGVCAAAPTFFWLMAARVLAACSHGLFFGVGGIAAIELVPPQKRGMAVALFLGGITVANVLGVPGGTALGNAFGWRWAFGAVALCALAATGMVAWLLPPAEARHAPELSLGAQFRVLLHQQVYLSYLLILLVMVGALAFATYQVPALINVTGAPQEETPFYLVIPGVGAVLGIYAGGRAADWKLMPSMTVILLGQAVVSALLMLAIHRPLAMACAMFLVGVSTWAMNAPVQSRILGAARSAPHLASTLISSAYNIGIAAGALVGGIWIDDGLGYASLPAIGIVCSFLATVVAVVSWRLDAPRPRLAEPRQAPRG